MAAHNIFGMVKSLMDAHTMGIRAAAELLRDCGYEVKIASKEIEDAIDKITSNDGQKKIISWIKSNKIKHLGISYRLDPDDAVNLVGRIVYVLKSNGLYESTDAQIASIFFAGLEDACKIIETKYDGRIRTFKGGESAEETLLTMGVLPEEIPKYIINGCQYDEELLKFGRRIIKNGAYLDQKPLKRHYYADFGTKRDTLVKRLDANFTEGFQPLIRAHSGPYSAEKSREKCVKEYLDWCQKLARTGFLDILSIGTSQLSQSNFGENWTNKKNGGGVPVKYEREYEQIWAAANPMLVRAYSGTKNVQKMAQMYEKTINISWHALSLWWFDELDGRGPNTLYKNLNEHIGAMRYIASVNKPVETNIPHHFAFRGCDDLTYIVSAYLGAKMAKMCGIKTFVLQNMLNTPRNTWGTQDIAKSRALIEIVKQLENENFRIILQTRAGLDFFKADLEEAKVQLAAVTAMMDDIEPDNAYSPGIIHVVSYSEALFLATPEIINDSIKITREALKEYRFQRKKGLTPDVFTIDILTRTDLLKREAKMIIQAMEESIENLYSASGLYIAFVAGWLPVPDLWSDSEEFLLAKKWQTKNFMGGRVIIEGGVLLPVESRINKCVTNISEAKYILKQKYGTSEKFIYERS